MSYTVVSGDTLSAIANRLGVSLSALEQANPMSNYNLIRPGQVLNIPGQSGGDKTAAAGGGMSTDDALSAYGYVFTVANSIPELKTLLNQATSEGWSAAKLQAKIESSPWWMQHADTVRNLAFQQYAEPGTYKQNLNNAKDLVKLKAQQLGRSFTDKDLTNLAIRSLTENFSFDDNRLTELVSNSLQLAHGTDGSLAGTAANLQDHMKQVAESYGVPFTQASLDTWTTQVQSGANSLDGFESVMRARAKATYPPLADQIDAGMTVRDIADPYIATYAQTLEVPETQVTLNDPYIKKALTQRDPGGTATIQPLWQFTRALKDDPRYDKTTQARSDAYTTLRQIGQDWGFEGVGQ